MPRCAGSKPDGRPCERIVGASQSYCYSHDPARSEERRRAASKAGKSKPSKELRAIKGRIEILVDGVLDGGIDRSDAAVIGQLWNTYLRALSVELKIREAEEFEGRLEAIEATLSKSRERVWG